MATPSIDPRAGGYVSPAGSVIAGSVAQADAAIARRTRCIFRSACVVNSATRERIKTYVLLLVMLVFGTAGNILLDKGMKRIGAIELSSSQTILAGAERILMSGTIWSGIFFLLLYMLSYMLVLSWADYSFVMPFTALSYAMVAVSGYVLLGEAVPATRWAGIALIVGGVFLVSRTPTSTTKAVSTVGNSSGNTGTANTAVTANQRDTASNGTARAAAGGR